MNSHNPTRDVPALITSLLSSFAFTAAHALLASHSSLPQQHVHAPPSGSGEDSLETVESVWVSSSMVDVARWWLFASCESGVRGRESSAIMSISIVRYSGQRDRHSEDPW